MKLLNSLEQIDKNGGSVPWFAHNLILLGRLLGGCDVSGAGLQLNR